jgi:hypothetical protein
VYVVTEFVLDLNKFVGTFCTFLFLNYLGDVGPDEVSVPAVFARAQTSIKRSNLRHQMVVIYT